MSCGYVGKILRVDLSQQRFSVDEPEEKFYRQYMGGIGLISYYLLKEQKAKIDPFSAENRLIIAAGVMTGTPVLGTGRSVFGGKSPLTNAICSSEMGGFLGAELKHAGYDAVIIEGRAAKPVYLWIHNGQAEIRDAAHLWGKNTGEAEDLIKEELGDPRIQMALIGPGGEKLVRFACVIHNLIYAAGRNGMGALMGSKNLKGIAVRGHDQPAMANPEAVKDLAKWIRDHGPTHPWLGAHYEWGTLSSLKGMNERGGMPTRNFQESKFEEMGKVDEYAYADKIRTGKVGCYACPVHCKSKVKVGKPYNVSERYGGPEWEAVSLLGPNCGIDDLGAIAKATELCNAYSIDYISAGGVIAFAMECFERGLITKKDTDGIQLTFGNVEGMLKVMEMICKREGIGDLLAEGSASAAQKIGKGAEMYAMQVKGSELPMHYPYLTPIVALGYALSPTGADHIRNIMVGGYRYHMPGPMLEAAAPFGLLEPLPARSDHLRSPAWVRTYMYITNWFTSWDCIGLCNFLGNGVQVHQVAEMVRGITGWNTTDFELMKVGERAMNMMRAFNIREGFTKQDDCIPERFYQPLASGPLKGAKLDKAEFEKSKETYYKMMGWSAEGIPNLEKLQELGIDWIAKLL